MKLRKRAVVLLLTLVLALSLIGCGKGKSGLVGTWIGEEEGITVEYTFNSNGTGNVKLMEMSLETSYKTDGDKLLITMSLLGTEQTQEYTYEVSGDTLKLDFEGSVAELKRK